MRRVLPQKRPFSPSQPSPTSSSRITNDLQSRPPKLIPDYLNPMPSHLLSTTLSDLLHAPTPSSPAIQSPPEVLPQGHHLVYFPIQTAPSKLAPDGADLDHSPGPEFPRRMWAGGEVNFHKGWRESLLMDGRPWRCKEEIGDVRVKGDKGQEKVFVDVWRRYGAKQEWDIEERRTLVFMRNTEGQLASAPRRATTFPHAASWSAKLVPTPTHLFHFSALTFNAHSIHIDPLYARSTDGHRDLLVHGPLTLALMLSVLGGGVQRISYRNHAPLYVNEEMTVCVRKPDNGGGWDVWVEGPEGGLAVRGKAVMDT
ncbi:MaoC like domain protein [Metarhizium robertsii]|uniref:MaoC like domain protein n=1 Tax=Metarhizium robertsii TaxID=568076 RepID=A0A0A1V0G6_9HYPO|nr:MaoC like domain protein [Metarhizium robertsii]